MSDSSIAVLSLLKTLFAHTSFGKSKAFGMNIVHGLYTSNPLLSKIFATISAFFRFSGSFVPNGVAR